ENTKTVRDSFRAFVLSWHRSGAEHAGLAKPVCEQSLCGLRGLRDERRRLFDHRAAATRARTCCSNSASGIGRRAGSPRTTDAVAVSDAIGGVISHAFAASAWSRKTPWPRPSR